METEFLTRLPIKLSELAELVEDGTVTAAYEYDRKGHMNYDDVGIDHRNSSYGMANDDIVCNVTFVAGYGTTEWYLLRDTGIQVQKEALQAQIDGARETVVAAEARLAELIAKQAE